MFCFVGVWYCLLVLFSVFFTDGLVFCYVFACCCLFGWLWIVSAGVCFFWFCLFMILLFVCFSVYLCWLFCVLVMVIWVDGCLLWLDYFLLFVLLFCLVVTSDTMVCFVGVVGLCFGVCLCLFVACLWCYVWCWMFVVCVLCWCLF